MRIITCDSCGIKCDSKIDNSYYLGDNPRLDLCPDCKKKFNKYRLKVNEEAHTKLKKFLKENLK